VLVVLADTTELGKLFHLFFIFFFTLGRYVPEGV